MQTLTEEELDADELAAGQARFSDPAWIYGDSQPLEVSREAAFPWGILRVDHSQADGVITQAALWSDGLEGDFLSLVPGGTGGVPEKCGGHSHSSVGPAGQPGGDGGGHSLSADKGVRSHEV